MTYETKYFQYIDFSPVILLVFAPAIDKLNPFYGNILNTLGFDDSTKMCRVKSICVDCSKINSNLISTIIFITECGTINRSLRTTLKQLGHISVV